MDHRLTEPPLGAGLLDSVSASSELSGGSGDGPVREVQEDHQRLDGLELAMLDSGLPVIHMPVTHRFTPGLYAREIFMPAGTIVASQFHETEHPYVVLSGRVQVAIPGAEPVILEAGHVGITLAGTRRALYIEADCRWITFHPLAQDEEGRRAAGASVDELLAMIRDRIITKKRRADGRDTYAEYASRLAAKGLPGPNSGGPAEIEQ